MASETAQPPPPLAMPPILVGRDSSSDDLPPAPPFKDDTAEAHLQLEDPTDSGMDEVNLEDKQDAPPEPPVHESHDSRESSKGGTSTPTTTTHRANGSIDSSLVTSTAPTSVAHDSQVSASTSVATSPPATSSSRAHDSRSRSSTVTSTATTSRNSYVSAVLVISSLEAIIASKEARKSVALAESGKAALALLRGETTVSAGTEAEVVFEPLRLACETRNPALMVTALDCIGKLVAYRFFSAKNVVPPLAFPSRARRASVAPIPNGAMSPTIDNPPQAEPLKVADSTLSVITHGLNGLNTPSTAGIDRPPSPVSFDKNRPEASEAAHTLAEDVTHTICNCFMDASCPDAVQLQIVKALLALILAPAPKASALPPSATSSTSATSNGAYQDPNEDGTVLQVHQSGLLRAVRTVYNIFLLSRNTTNQAVAQGALTQMVSHVFTRVEIGESAAISMAARLKEYALRMPDLRDKGRERPLPVISPVLGGTGGLDNITIPEVTIQGEDDSPTPVDSVEDNTQSFEESKPTNGVVAKQSGLTGLDDTQEINLGTPKESMDTDEDSLNSPFPVSTASTAKPSIPTPPNTSIGMAPPEEQTITLESFERHNSFDGVTEKEPSASSSFMTLQDYYVKDAFLVFRALCKLSMKPLGTESERDLKSHAMRSKLLSLHLILSILSTNSPMFIDPSVIIFSASTKERTQFVQAIKQYLCLSLSRNAISSVLSVFEISCEIFWRVLSGMRNKLKKEIEVLLKEIFLPILDMRNSTVKQKSILLTALGRVCQDPQAMVEIYLNYDCDRTSLDNVYERLMNIISKLSTTQYTTSTTSSQSIEMVGSTATSGVPGKHFMIIPPSLNTTSMSQGMSDHTSYIHLAVEAQLKRQSLECLVSALKSLVTWAGKGAYATNTLVAATGLAIDTPAADQASLNPLHRSSHDGAIGSANASSDALALDIDKAGENGDFNGASGIGSDDPERFENAKHRKTTLIEGIRQFNFKPKRGIKFLIQQGFIKSPASKDIAKFLLNADGLNKAQVGEYLGDGDATHIETMHYFIDLMDFNNMIFTDAMRQFLQAFRLPGEAQKIDRFMLKFAERYFQGNSGVLANAETAYILAFSIIMLNTDAHSPQIKNRMTKAEFIRNNRGINQGADLPEEYLSSVFDEIINNEIRMKDEVEAAAGQQVVPSGLAGSIATVGRDLKKEAYVLQSTGMANKTEALFRTLLRGQRRGARPAEQFYEASHYEHVRPMFEAVWMPLLAGIADPLHNTEDMTLITLSLTGFKQAIKIVCLFDLELERNAFVTTLAKFTFLNNLGDMKAKNVEAIKALLDVAMIDGNYLKGSWKDVLSCVSQLERFQLISRGVDASTVSDLGRRGSTKKPGKSVKSKKPSDAVTGAAGASHITYAADMVFSSSHNLSATAIVDFVQALSTVSWEEIQASGLSGEPRTFCLQKLVEISYYNMGRIRLEWTQIWEILGAHFNQVCCHSNANVSFFALDSLRQLAMRFLEKEELANFKFQKDFLRPFEHTMLHNSNPEVRDMVLQCLNQMIAARVDNLRSGWRTMFGVFGAASKVLTERVATQAFEIVQLVNKDHFSRVVEFGSFADLTVCITDFCKISKYQKISLHAIEMLRATIPAMLTCPQCPLSQIKTVRLAAEVPAIDDPMIKYWFPVLFGFYDVIMNGEDLEVRKRALDYLFDTLKKHGDTFPADFWDSVCKEVLFPIFAVLRSRNDVSRFSNQEDMSVWLSTTMIQALRNLIDLYTFYFDTLGRNLDRLLDLLCECICQENDTLARIGTSCLQQLLEKNVAKLDSPRWERVISTFINLFKTTTAYQLFDENLRTPYEAEESAPSPSDASNQRFIAPTPLSPMPESGQDRISAAQQPIGIHERRKVFRQIIVKCVLQLLLIETTNELLSNTEVYDRIPPADLLRLLSVVDDSYRFAKKFNADKDLRMGLWKVGFMKQLPNLLKQESSSAVTLVQVLLRMYLDERPAHLAKRKETVDAFVPLGLDVVAGYVSLDPDTQARNVTAWTPVATEVVNGFCSFEKETFLEYLPSLYPLLIKLIQRDIVPEVRSSIYSFLQRVGSEALALDMDSVPLTLMERRDQLPPPPPPPHDDEETTVQV